LLVVELKIFSYGLHHTMQFLVVAATAIALTEVGMLQP